MSGRIHPSADVHPSAQVDPSAVVDEGVTIGPESRVWHFVHVSKGAQVGARCSLGQNVFVGPAVRVADGVKVQNNVSIYVGVELEKDVFLGPSCVFTNVLNPRAHVERKSEFAPTFVRRGATVGANATVICGNELGAYCLVGAGAVVTKPVPPHALVLGVPAERAGWVCRCGERLPGGEHPACGRCGDRYRVEGDALHLVSFE